MPSPKGFRFLPPLTSPHFSSGLYRIRFETMCPCAPRTQKWLCPLLHGLPWPWPVRMTAVATSKHQQWFETEVSAAPSLQGRGVSRPVSAPPSPRYHRRKFREWEGGGPPPLPPVEFGHLPIRHWVPASESQQWRLGASARNPTNGPLPKKNPPSHLEAPEDARGHRWCLATSMRCCPAMWGTSRFALKGGAEKGG